MIPGFSFKCLETRKFLVPIGFCSDQRDFAAFGCDQQQAVIRDQQHLPAAIATCAPAQRAIFKADTSEDTPSARAVKSIKVIFKDDKVIEIGFEVLGCPKFTGEPDFFFGIEVELNSPCSAR